jgi:hypothetical protein
VPCTSTSPATTPRTRCEPPTRTRSTNGSYE